MGGMNVKTKSVISESLKPMSEHKKDDVGILDESKLLDEI
jgi:hypothetical protein